MEMMSKAYAKPTRRSVKPAADKNADENRPDNANISDDEVVMEDDEPKDRPQCLFDDDRDVAGEKMYGFHTPKKRNAMARLAENTPRTPTIDMSALSLNSPQTSKGRASRAGEQHLRTPSTHLKALSLNSPRTPKSHLPLHLSTKTPQTTRDRLKKATLKKIVESDDEDSDSDYQASGDASSESSASSSAEDDSDTESRAAHMTAERRNKYEAKPAVDETPSTRRSARTRKQPAAQDDFIPDSDNYFRSVSSKMVRDADSCWFQCVCVCQA